MKSVYRKIIRNPGRQKTARWATSLHEAGHCIAYTVLGKTWARTAVFGYGGKGGGCWHGSTLGSFEADLICVAAGPAAQSWAGWLPCPKGRPRRVRGAMPVVESDEKLEGAIVDYLNRTMAPAVPIIVGDADKVAVRFVRDYLNEIVVVAERLYLRGWDYIPKSQTAASCRGEVSRMAAHAAKGF